MERTTTVLHTANLSVGYRNGHHTACVLSGLDLRLYAGETVCLIGANGAGKSTLLRTLSGVQPPLSGDLFVGDRRLGDMKARELARRISIVYTDRTLAGALTVREVVGLGRQPYTGFFGRLSADDNAVVDDALRAVGIGNMAGRYMATLSDGERQKTMIARALAQTTPVIILDEPTSFLDVASRLEVMSLLRDLSRSQDKSLLLSTHDIGEALTVADRLWLVMPDGSVVCGPVADMIAGGYMDRVFVGRNIRFDAAVGDYRSAK